MENTIFTGLQGPHHIQGIAVDEKKGYIYYSFTTKFIKATLDGTVVGSVCGLAAHLGCIAFHKEDGLVYGSLEYKHDSIGKGLIAAVEDEEEVDDGFYLAIFDVDKIDRMDMDAEKDGIMSAVYLKEVVDDYQGNGLNKKGEVVPHTLGCSGIDGTAIGPMFGAPKDSKKYVFITYGVYGDVERDDNDHQVIVCYDPEEVKPYAQPLNQRKPHKSGPAAPLKKLFVFTGNTVFGVQNFEYDPYTESYFMAVYRGQKPEYPNYDLMAVDANVAPDAENKLALKKMGQYHETSNTYGWYFPDGACGLYACGDGRYYIAKHAVEEGQCCGYISVYRWDEKTPFV